MSQSEPVSVRNAKLLALEANFLLLLAGISTMQNVLCFVSVCFLGVFSSSIYGTLFI